MFHGFRRLKLKTTINTIVSGRLAGRSAVPITPFGLILAAVAVVVALSLLGASVFGRQQLSVNMSNGEQDVALDSPLQVSSGLWPIQLQDVALYRQPLDEAGQPGQPEAVPVSIDTTRLGLFTRQSAATLALPGGRLEPDSVYRLVVAGSVTFPWPGAASFEREVQFATLSSPRPVPQTAPTELRWQAPFAIRWSSPISDFDYTITPAVKSHSWIDEQNPSIAHIQLDAPEESTEYRITIDRAQGTNGVALQRPATYVVETPARPKLVGSEEPITVEIGQPATLKWNVPIDSLKIGAPSSVSVNWAINPNDAAVTKLELGGLKQGETYELTVSSVTAKNGAPLAQPQKVTIVTPPPLDIAEFNAGEGDVAPTSVQPEIVFSEPIRDRNAVEQAIKVEPAVLGHFEWTSDKAVKFVPDQPFPYESEVSIALIGGEAGPRSADGSFLEADKKFTFVTEPNKIIDVNLTTQTMALIEGNQTVQTFPVATGVAGAETPTGEFRVQYKMPIARFRGVNPSGVRYDIPDVRWVLAFWGDYTIHGAYWRSNFGSPGSAGCVSLTDANAKIVYDWSPPGTLVRIHY